MEYLERMRPQEAERMMELVSKLLVIIEEKNYSYHDVIRALDSIKNNYEKKGCDLLNSASIQEVAKFNGLLN